MLEPGHYNTTALPNEVRWNRGGAEILDVMFRRGARVFLSSMAMARSQLKNKLRQTVKKELREDWKIGDWHLLKIGDCPAATFDFESFVQTAGADLGSATVLTEIYLDSKKTPPQSPVAAKWFDILKFTEIPFDLNVRHEKLKHAYQTLQDYIKDYEAKKDVKEGVTSFGTTDYSPSSSAKKL
jgi:hypothetical protein